MMEAGKSDERSSMDGRSYMRKEGRISRERRSGG